jgi:hypothetical protein
MDSATGQSPQGVLETSDAPYNTANGGHGRLQHPLRGEWWTFGTNRDGS